MLMARIGRVIAPGFPHHVTQRRKHAPALHRLREFPREMAGVSLAGPVHVVSAGR